MFQEQREENTITQFYPLKQTISEMVSEYKKKETKGRETTNRSTQVSSNRCARNMDAHWALLVVSRGRIRVLKTLKTAPCLSCLICPPSTLLHSTVSTHAAALSCWWELRNQEMLQERSVGPPACTKEAGPCWNTVTGAASGHHPSRTSHFPPLASFAQQRWRGKNCDVKKAAHLREEKMCQGCR